MENKRAGATLGVAEGFEEGHHVVFPYLRTADYRASVPDVAKHLLHLMQHPDDRARLGRNGRKRVVERFDYRVVARQFVEIVGRKLGIH
jgi:glycosyltransferase involved in cell wall biosynthesis